MRRKERQITDKETILEILEKSNICRLGISDKEYPYIVPMNYGYQDNSLYFHCAPEGRKLDLISVNNNVCFEVESQHEILKDEESCRWTTKYRSIIGNGKIEVMTDRTEKIKGLNIIMEHHGKMNNLYNEKILDKLVVLRLDIDSMTAKQSGEW